MSYLIPPTFDEPDGDGPLDAPRWFAVYTGVRKEKRAALTIMDALKPRDHWRDLAVWLPVETYWGRHARKVERLTRPLLGRYLFVYIRDEHIHVVRDCDGVDDFVRAGGKPRPVDARRLNGLRDDVESGLYDTTRGEDYGGPYKAGDGIEVKLGKFTGWPGRVLKMTSATRARVLLSMFGKEHEKELEVSELKAA